MVLLISTLAVAQRGFIEELIMIVPDSEAVVFQSMLPVLNQLKFFRTGVQIVRETTLIHALGDQTYESYAIQMALKLAAAKIVRTHFYLTLDCDVLLTNPKSLLRSLTKSHGGYRKANFEDESRMVHKHWWESSAKVLRWAL